MNNTRALVAALTALFGAHAAAQPNFDSQSLVYIECVSPDGATTRRGTGVIVGDNGLVLTARHVAPPDYNCRGVRGDVAETPTRPLIRRRASDTYDAATLAFNPRDGETFHAVGFVNLSAAAQDANVVAYGFPADGAGSRDIVPGAITNRTPNDEGMVRTNVMTSRGMSGGPVLMTANGGLIGIVAGAQFDPATATPTNYGVLAAELVASELSLAPYKAEPAGAAPLPSTLLVTPPDSVRVIPVEANALRFASWDRTIAELDVSGLTGGHRISEGDIALGEHSSIVVLGAGRSWLVFTGFIDVDRDGHIDYLQHAIQRAPGNNAFAVAALGSNPRMRPDSRSDCDNYNIRVGNEAPLFTSFSGCSNQAEWSGPLRSMGTPSVTVRLTDGFRAEGMFARTQDLIVGVVDK